MEKDFEESNNKQQAAKNYFIEGIKNFENKNYQIARDNFKESYKLLPNRLNTIVNLCATLIMLDEDQEAEALITKYINIYTSDESFYRFKGDLLAKKNKYKEAIYYYDISLRINKLNEETLNNKGIAFKKLRNYEEALECFNDILVINPNNLEALHGKGSVYMELKNWGDALDAFEKILEKDYFFHDSACNHLGIKLQTCDWANLDMTSQRYLENLNNEKIIVNPFRILGIIDDPTLHKKVALMNTQQYVENRKRNEAKVYKNKKIKLAYFSADFHNHATAYLISELFEKHDKNTFEIYGFSYGMNINDESRKRIINALDRFIDIQECSDEEVINICNEMKIDIAIDLKGFTQEGRPSIFIKRCAPIQVNYLGYPGTMGHKSYDYIIADKIVIPEDQKKNYIENIVYMPYSYQVNDTQKIITNKKYSRKDEGLPEDSFVYCCFNNSYKILPSLFEIWTRILNKVPNSVLWLIEDNEISSANLNNIFVEKGMDSKRLIFAKKVPNPEHLARIQLADLFLDTFPYNAHTTCSDAIWSGLPVLTCPGKSFASRVAASLLIAADLTEFISKSLNDYEEKAIYYGLNKRILNNIREDFKINCKNKKLFNINEFTNNFEKILVDMINKYNHNVN
jgi:predicted O-linked N-acetylglucosamine transferase (SPINDLY family)